MNPLTNVKNIQKMNERMLDMGVEDSQAWHKQYKDSAYVFIGGLPFDLTEGDILCVFSQYGEIVNINLVRDKKTGKSKGFCFLCYEDQRSTILAVDNFNGIKLGGRTIRVDHCSNYRRPLSDEKDEHGKRKEIIEEGCAPKTPSPSPPASEDEEILELPKKRKKEKKTKKEKKHKEEKLQKKKETMSSSVEEDLEGPNSKKRKRMPGSEDNNRDMTDRDLPDRDLPDRDLPRDRDMRNVKARVVMRDSGRDRDFGDRHINKLDGDSKNKEYRDVHSSDRKPERELNEGDRKSRNRERDIRERDREAHRHEFRDNHIFNNRRQQRDKDYHHSSRDNRVREVDERKRDRFDRREHKRDEGRKHDRRDRNNFGDRKDRR